MGKKVTFTLPAEIVGEATSAVLLGEFNNWDYSNGISLKKQKDGSMKVTTTLEGGRTYQYRYLLNDGRWVNDQKADDYVHVSGFQVENCVIAVPAEEEIVTETAAAPTKAPKAVKEKKVKTVKAKAETVADDLTKIEGIGKKIAALLIAENILTFKDLSKTTVKKLKGILEVAGSKYQLHDPSTWPKQAKLAAAAKWEELEALQKELIGGK
ncbi:MAG TPA: helix-hairpin-helix domain-containing protein [Chitinophagaceae bacterium]|nr:helix-hairpin-helix domain-containing protein [Chitinophagaceae bacterium]